MNALKKIIVGMLDVFTLFLPKKKEIPLSKVKRILVINCGLIGDTLVSFPALNSLRNLFENAHITQIVNPKCVELLKYNQDYDELITYRAPWLNYKHHLTLLDIKEWNQLRKKIKGYDLVIDLRGDFRNLLFILYPAHAPLRVGHTYSGGKYLLNKKIAYPSKHEVENQLELIKQLGGKDVPYTYRVGKKEREKLNNLLPQGEYVLFLPTPGYEEKSWGDENWINLGKQIPSTIVFAGAPNDAHVKEIKKHLPSTKVLDFSGKLTLNELAALITRMRLVIGVDTGPMHLTAALNKKSIALFGPTDPKRWKPYQNSTVLVNPSVQEVLSTFHTLAQAS